MNFSFQAGGNTISVLLNDENITEKRDKYISRSYSDDYELIPIKVFCSRLNIQFVDPLFQRSTVHYVIIRSSLIPTILFHRYHGRLCISISRDVSLLNANVV